MSTRWSEDCRRHVDSLDVAMAPRVNFFVWVRLLSWTTSPSCRIFLVSDTEVEQKDSNAIFFVFFARISPSVGSSTWANWHYLCGPKAAPKLNDKWTCWSRTVDTTARRWHPLHALESIVNPLPCLNFLIGQQRNQCSSVPRRRRVTDTVWWAISLPTVTFRSV